MHVIGVPLLARRKSTLHGGESEQRRNTALSICVFDRLATDLFVFCWTELCCSRRLRPNKLRSLAQRCPGARDALPCVVVARGSNARLRRRRHCRRFSRTWASPPRKSWRFWKRAAGKFQSRSFRNLHRMQVSQEKNYFSACAAIDWKGQVKRERSCVVVIFHSEVKPEP